jgi:dTDP-glucose 4,6-dehydratase
MRVLVTGGAGFIGSHLVEHLHVLTPWHITVLDGLNYAGSLDRLAQFRSDSRVSFVFHNICAPLSSQLLSRIGYVDYIIHAAAETHVENSLRDPAPFVMSNIVGTFNMLEASRKLQPRRFVMVSTDEVFGPAPVGVDYKEHDRFAPTNPYSATKAASDCLSMAYQKSMGVPLILTRTMNNFGERQHPEKFVPMVIRKVLAGETVTIHAGKHAIGSRKWLHARNHADAILFMLLRDLTGVYHIAGEEHDNLEMAQMIASIIGLPLKHEIVDYHSQRPGHDLRYSLDDSKLRTTGWKPPIAFASSLRRCVEWTLRNKDWMNA